MNRARSLAIPLWSAVACHRFPPEVGLAARCGFTPSKAVASHRSPNSPGPLRLVCALFAFAFALALTLTSPLSAFPDGVADNLVDKVRPIPPPGVEIPADDRRQLTGAVARLGAAIESARPDLPPATRPRITDVEIFHKAVDWALRYNEFFATNEVTIAKALLAEGWKRLGALVDGRTPWLSQTGPVALGYVSRIDGSVQPYGLVVPDGFSTNTPQRFRLDFWFHGRGEKLSELSFINDRTNRRGEFAPAGAFVLHPYGRYCNGSRFAGEVDAWEALANAQSRYPIDNDRLVVRGFSLGGASCWHFAVHHAARWAAAAPGAGFSETAEFLRVFQNEKLQPSWWEQKLWNLHDATAHALNVSMVPLVAYSGEKDSQRQAAIAMEHALAAEDLDMTHVIGTGAGHNYTPAAREEINRRLDAAALHGRDPLPTTVRFVTHSLRFPTMAWVTLDALGQHWEPARIEAKLFPAENRIVASLTNITALTFEIQPGLAPFDLRRPVSVELNGQTLPSRRPQTDRSWSASFHLADGQWTTGVIADDGSLRKRAGLQGPIDDAFMDAFLFVRPTGTPLNETVGKWTRQEMQRAIEQWRSQFRGDVRIKDDTALTDADRAAHHLILWGDPSSNAELARIAPKLTIRWDASGVALPGRTFSADHFAPILIQPNPSHPARYVVLNSGFTFREYDYLNNARQTPKLPDWAIVDLSQPPNSRFPGAIATAGFFGERWEWKAPPADPTR